MERRKRRKKRVGKYKSHRNEIKLDLDIGSIDRSIDIELIRVVSVPKVLEYRKIVLKEVEISKIYSNELSKFELLN